MPGALDPLTGTFTPEDPEGAIDGGQRLNPYIDPGPWGIIRISNFRLPGVVRSVDGASKPEEWSVQKATAKSNATTVWKGTKLAESIKIVMALHDAASVSGYYDLRDLLRPKIGTKPPSHIIANPIFNFSGITRISFRDIAPPKWVPGDGYWEGAIDILEFNPEKKSNTGPASGAKAWTEAKGSDPNADVKAELQKTLDEASKA